MKTTMYPLGLATRFKSKKRSVSLFRKRAKRALRPLFVKGTKRRRLGAHRPVVIWTGAKFRRPKNSRLFPKPTRINPRRSRRFYRRNPLRLPLGIDRSLMTGLPVAGGVALSMFAMPQIARFLPASLAKYEKFYGVVHIAIGVAAMALVRKDVVRTVGGTVLAMGIYDLIASNVPQLKLPPISRGLPAQPAGAEEIVGSSYQEQVGTDYAPAFGASYGASYGDDIDYGSDDIEIG